MQTLSRGLSSIACGVKARVSMGERNCGPRYHSRWHQSSNYRSRKRPRTVWMACSPGSRSQRLPSRRQRAGSFAINTRGYLAAALSQHKMFSRFASASRRAARHARQLSTAAAGDGSGFLIAGGVGVAAIACMAPRADEGHAAAPALPADEASKKLLAVLSHGEELAKIAKVKATMPDNIARRGVETKRRWRADDCDSRAGHPEVQF